MDKRFNKKAEKYVTDLKTEICDKIRKIDNTDINKVIEFIYEYPRLIFVPKPVGSIFSSVNATMIWFCVSLFLIKVYQKNKNETFELLKEFNFPIKNEKNKGA